MNSQANIRSEELFFLITEDHALIVFSLNELIKDTFPNATIFYAKTVDALNEQIKETKFDCIILDITLQDGSSLNSLEYIRLKQPEAKLLVFSGMDEISFGRHVLKNGADGFIHKHAELPEIKKAILQIFDGQKYLSPKLQYALSMQSLNDTNNKNPFEQLSKREFEVAILLLQGKTVQEISETLSLNHSTISTHKISIWEKLKIKSVIELNEIALLYNIKQF